VEYSETEEGAPDTSSADRTVEQRVFRPVYLSQEHKSSDKPREVSSLELHRSSSEESSIPC